MVIARALAMLLVLASCFIAGCARIALPASKEFSGETGGCGDFFVYRFNDSKTLAVAVYVDEKAFAVTNTPAEIEITLGSKTALVEVVQFRRPAIDYFCDDVGGDSPPIATWKAISGKIVIERYQLVLAGTAGNATHKVTVILRNVRLRDVKSDRESTLSEVRFDEVLVGWKA